MTQWTEERRAAQSKKLKETHAAKKAAKEAELVDINPPSNEIIQDPDLPARPATLRSGKPPARPALDFDPAEVIATLSELPIESLSYDACGLLLNAFSAASNSVALRRRQAQEQMVAGTHRAPCSTCGRSIDISKPGGFQILTERDEFWQPRNVFFCSQNCLLAKNMPGRRKEKVAGDVGAKA